MSVVIPPAAPQRVPMGPRKKLTIVVGMVAVILLGAGGVALTFVERQYGPVAPGNFGGIASLDSFSYTESNEYHLKASGGQVWEAIRNTGSHSISVTSMTSEPSVSRLQWSPFEFIPDGELGPKNAHWQNFPATVPANGVILLLATLQRPQSCSATSDGTYQGYSALHEVHWKSLLGSHTTSVRNMMIDVNLC